MEKILRGWQHYVTVEMRVRIVCFCFLYACHCPFSVVPVIVTWYVFSRGNMFSLWWCQKISWGYQLLEATSTVVIVLNNHLTLTYPIEWFDINVLAKIHASNNLMFHVLMLVQYVLSFSWIYPVLSAGTDLFIYYINVYINYILYIIF